jgi:nitronate monooxygenase
VSVNPIDRIAAGCAFILYPELSSIRSIREHRARGFSMFDKSDLSPRDRAEGFAHSLGIRLPILLAPMAGASPPSLSIAVANAGGLGACGALLMTPEEIQAWGSAFREGSAGEFRINLWIPEAPPVRDFDLEKGQRAFLATWGPAVPPEAGDARLPDFEAQCQAMLSLAPKAISSIMGLYAPAFVSELKARGILWFANATTVTEAKAAEDAGADAIVAQGMEAGGHRGAFREDEAEQQMVGLVALLPQVVDAVTVPVIAAGGIADARGLAAAQCGHRIRPGSKCSRCSASSIVSCSARADSRDARRSAEGWRCRSYAIVGRTGSQAGAESTRRRHLARVVGIGLSAVVVICIVRQRIPPNGLNESVYGCSLHESGQDSVSSRLPSSANREKTTQAEFGSFLRARRVDTTENVRAANYTHTLSEIAMQRVWPTFRFAQNRLLLGAESAVT